MLDTESPLEMVVVVVVETLHDTETKIKNNAKGDNRNMGNRLGQDFKQRGAKEW